MIKKLILIAILTFNFACTKLIVPEVGTNSSANANKAWANVLIKHVNSKGEVDFYGIKKNPGALHQYIEYISRISPMSHPTHFPKKNDKLAFYINSYNALSMYNIIQGEIPTSFSGMSKISYFKLSKMKIGGQYMSLSSYENDIIRAIGDERVHFALNCMSKGCPQLPKKPFTNKNLDNELEREASKFLNDSRNLKINDQEKKVYLSKLFDFFTEDFLKKSKSLIGYVNKYRSKKLNESLEVDFLDFDWTVKNSYKTAKPKDEDIQPDEPEDTEEEENSNY